MKKTINGKRYDTNSATRIWKWAVHHDIKRPTYFSETLYRLPRGGWFLVSEGKRLSPYGVRGAHGRVAGAKIVPLSHKEAITWLESHGKHGIASLHEKR